MSHFFHLGLAGWPLAHSLSPRLHQAALQACGLSGVYELYPFPPLPAGRAEMSALLARLRSGELDGLNVTIPHKQSVLPLLDTLTPTAQAVGAANTLFRAEEQLVGENTDVDGFLRDLDDRVAENFPGQLIQPGHALVLGAGGAARAVVYALTQRGWQVHLAARRPEQAEQLAAGFSHLSPAPTALAQPLLEAADLARLSLRLLVNATPVGMTPHEEASPWPENLPLPPGCFVYDLVYNPPETRLLRQAKRQGIPAANGLGMLVNQATLAFLRWTGLPGEKYPIIQEAMYASIYTEKTT